MVRNQYKLNDKLDGEKASLEAMLRQTSASLAPEKALSSEWLIDWTTLFDDRNSLKSRRLGPEMAPTLVSDDLDALFGEFDDPTRQDQNNGGLAYRDLIRGAESNLRSVESIIQHLPGCILELSPFVRDRRINTSAIESWSNRGGTTETEREYINCINKDVPLLFFIMLEAANTSMPDQDIDYGENLGAIGSVIIAECLFKEYWRTFPVIEANDQVKEVSYLIFGQDFPNTMSKLITQILRRKNWTEVQPKFW